MNNDNAKSKIKSALANSSAKATIIPRTTIIAKYPDIPIIYIYSLVINVPHSGHFNDIHGIPIW